MKLRNLYIALFSVIIDAVAIFGGIVAAYMVRTDGGQLFNWPFETYWKLVLLVTPVWLVLFASQGLYNPRALPRGWSGLGRLLIGLVAGWGAVLIILYFWRSPEAVSLSRLLVIYAIVLSALFAVVGRLIINLMTDLMYRTGSGLTKTVIIDGGVDNLFAKELAHRRNGRNILAVFPAETALEKLTALRRTTKIEEVIVDHQNLSEEKLLQFLNWAEMHGANFAVVPSLLSVRATNVETTTLAGTPVMYFLRTPLEGWRRVYKRLFDLVIVIPALIILSPLLFLLFIASQLATGSGIITQLRVGQDGRVFKIHKFRSMYVDADTRFPEYKGWSTDESKDPRITKVGRILRKTNLDELAQLWDVFIGQMSLVGPRPEQPHYVEKFAKEIPDYLRRHHVKTGLTGWAQINGLRGNTSIPERVKYDLFYIEHWSIWFDIRIVLATLLLVLKTPFSRS